MSCPIEYVGLQNPGGGYVFSLILLITFPIVLVLSLILFVSQKHQSVFLRKRSMKLLSLQIFGCLSVYNIGPLYNIIGPQVFPCALFVFAVYIAVPFFIFAQVYQLNQYSSEVAAKKLAFLKVNQGGIGRLTSHQLSKRMDSFSSDVTSVDKNDDDYPEINLAGEASWKTLKGHIMVVFLRNRTRENLLLNARFSRSWGGFIFYFILMLSPYLITYLIRLGTDPIYYTGCHGCEIPFTDCICLISLHSFVFFIGLCTVPRIIDPKRDPLQITRESRRLNWLMLPGNIPLILILTDPDQINSTGVFSWRDLWTLSGFLQIFLLLIYPVILSRRLTRIMLVSENFNREDRFNDVMKNKQLRQELKVFLNSELSLEILLFIEAVDHYRHVYNSLSPDKREKKVETIYQGFIKRGAENEVNLSSRIRDEIIDKKHRGAVEVTIFDAAYYDVKSSLLKDGFTRFLDRIKKKSDVESQHVSAHVVAAEEEYSVHSTRKN